MYILEVRDLAENKSDSNRLFLFRLEHIPAASRRNFDHRTGEPTGHRRLTRQDASFSEPFPIHRPLPKLSD